MHRDCVRWRWLRPGIVSALLASFLVGCGETTPAPGGKTTVDPKAGSRRKEMAEFLKNQPPPAAK